MRTSFSIRTKTTPLGIESRNRLVRPAGSRKNRPTAKTSANTIVPAQAPLPRSFSWPSSRGGTWAFAEIPSARKPILSDSASATTPRTSGSRSSRWRLVHDTSGSETTSISPAAASLEPGPPAASCSALGLRTATAHVEMPRIITPSSTACPPIGASLVASRMPRWYRRPVPRLLAARKRRAGNLVRVVGLRRLHDHPVGVDLGLHRPGALRSLDADHRAPGGHQLGHRDRVDDVSVDGQPHGHVGRRGDPLVGHEDAVTDDALPAQRLARDRHRLEIRQQVELAAGGRAAPKGLDQDALVVIPAEVDLGAVERAGLEALDRLLVGERAHARLRLAPAAEARGLERVQPGVALLEQLESQRHALAAGDLVHARDEQRGARVDRAAGHLDARGRPAVARGGRGGRPAPAAGPAEAAPAAAASTAAVDSLLSMLGENSPEGR